MFFWCVWGVGLVSHWMVGVYNLHMICYRDFDDRGPFRVLIR